MAKASCTMQAPFHRSIFLPVFLLSQSPRFRSGAKIMGWSLGMELIMSSALDEVQTISVKALIAADVLT